MTREHKLALIVGFALVLVVGVLISDHLSRARTTDVADADSGPPAPSLAESPGFGREPEPFVLNGEVARAEPASPIDESYFTDEPDEPRIRGLADQAIGLLGSTQNSPSASQVDEFITPSPTRADQPEPERSREIPQEVEVDRRDMPVHRVQRGESLWSIAERYYDDGHLHDELREYNAGRTGPDGTLQVGTRLYIPPQWMLTGEPATAPRRQQPERAKPRTYEVKAGDTLGEISMEMLGTSKRWREILDLNSGTLEDEHSLAVGMTLKIPAR